MTGRLAGLFFLVLITLLLWPGLIGGQTLVPWDYLTGNPSNELMSDLVLQNYPWKQLANASFLRGELPLWNPYIFAGVPFLAAAQSGSLYPLGVPVFLLLPLEYAYTWFFALHLFIAAIGTYWFLRVIGTGRWGSTLGGTVFGLAGFLVVNPQWPQATGTIVWLPILLGLLELILRRTGWSRVPWILAGALVVAVQWLAGHPELSFYSLLTAGAYTLARLLSLAMEHRHSCPGARAGVPVLHAVAALAMVAIGTLLAAVQLVPFIDIIRDNQRAGGATVDQVRAWALPPEHLIAFVLPDFFGNPTQGPTWGAKNYVEGAAYLGILPLLLVIPAWLLTRNRYTVFFTAWAVFSLLMAFGTPLYGFFFGIPGFDQLHTPFRWVFPYSFAITVLAARGFDALLRSYLVPRTSYLVPVAALLIAAVDLLHFGWGFIRFQDPQPPQRHPAIAFLQGDPDVFRIATYGEGKVFPPNSAMLAGLQDVRGYDTIIPKPYVEFWRRMEEPSGLPYSQINSLADPRSLDSLLLDQLNVKYLLTRDPIDHPRWRPVILSEAEGAQSALHLGDPDPAKPAGHLLLYENLQVLPRAYILAGSAPVPARITGYTPNRVTISASGEGRLILSDAYAPGWTAKDASGRLLTVTKANDLLRAVHLPPGDHTITFTYSPDSFKLGLYLTLLGAVAAAAVAGAYAWSRFGYRLAEGPPVRRVVKNAVTPMAAQIVARAVDLGFAIFMLRVLGPADYGGYAFAAALIGYFAIFTDFGLGTLLTREVARRTEEGRRYVANTIGVRLVLCLAAAPVLGAAAWAYHLFFGLSTAAALAALLFMAALGPSSIAGALSALFSAHERMEYPAGIVVLTSLAKAFLGIAALLLGWGVLGLGLVSLLSSALTAAVFWALVSRHFFVPGIRLEPAFAAGMLRTAIPLVLNSLLNSVFFRIDVLLLQAIKGAEAVGIYSTAYKFVDGLLIIPSAFILALFPIMSRQGNASHEDLKRTYAQGLRALLLIALPAAVGITAVAEDLVVGLFGPAYQPASPVLQLLIWFLPFSYLNGLTQYVLIALDRQRFITFAFAIATAFNLGANLVVLPVYGPMGAAAVTVVSEVVLMVPFAWEVRRLIGLPLIATAALKAGAAAAAMGTVLVLLDVWPFWALVPAGALTYAATLWLLRALDDDDLGILRRLVGRMPTEEAPAMEPGVS